MSVSRGREDSAALAGVTNGYAPLDSDLLTPASYLNYKLPTVVAVGTSATGTGDVVPGLPSGHTTNDILLIFVQTSNQAAVATNYTQLGPSAGFGTAAAAGSMRLTVLWKRDGGSETDPTVTDSGDHTIAQMIAIRGCPTTGDPFLNIGAKRKTTASTTGTATAGATPIDNCLVIDAFAHALDSASAVFSSFTNTDLNSVTEQIDVATADGTGGGIGVSTGGKLIAGNFAATTVTETSTTDVSTTFIMLPAGIHSRAGFIDRQVFITTGANTWIKPTGAKIVQTIVIGGGSSGSAGRNAATAAGGGGGGGGAYMEAMYPASFTSATSSITVGSGGAATANTDGAASNIGSASVSPGTTANGGLAAGVSATGSGGVGGAGGGFGSALGASVFSFTSQPPGGGTGGTTAGAGGFALGMGNASGGSGAGGGTTQATSAGGSALRSGAGGGGGRSNTNVGTGGAGGMLGAFAGGATAGANGTDGTSDYGAGGGAGGTSAAGPGGQGGWPGGGGGGGGSQSGAQRGGAGGDGVVTMITFC